MRDLANALFSIYNGLLKASSEKLKTYYEQHESFINPAFEACKNYTATPFLCGY